MLNQNSTHKVDEFEVFLKQSPFFRLFCPGGIFGDLYHLKNHPCFITFHVASQTGFVFLIMKTTDLAQFLMEMHISRKINMNFEAKVHFSIRIHEGLKDA